MNILTVSANPYLVTKLGKLNKFVLKNFQKEGHKVGSVVWHLDPTYFMPEYDEEENPKFYYEEQDDKLFELFPVPYGGEAIVPASYEAMVKFAPDVVITIGDHSETAWMHAIKSMYPHLFKWIALLTPHSFPISSEYRDALRTADALIATNQIGAKNISDLTEFNCEYIPFGADPAVYYADSEPEDFVVIGTPKNSQSSNIGAWIHAVGHAGQTQIGFEGKLSEKIKGYLHTNLNDPGDYIVEDLLDRFGCLDFVDLPDRYVSISEGFSEEDMAKEYRKSSVVMDLSVRSSTGLGLLEAMSCGCVPLVSGSGAIREIANHLNNEFLIAGSLPFIGDGQETMYVSDPFDASYKLVKLYKMWKDEKSKFSMLRSSSIEIAKRYLPSLMESKLSTIVCDVCKNKNPELVVDKI